MRKVQPLLYSLALALTLPSSALASSCANGNYCKLDPINTFSIPDASLQDQVGAIIDILGIIAGVLSVIFLIIGGINYITSEGDPKKLAGAKNTIAYAIAGLVISILATQIVGFVLQNAPK
jgi:hypothetical protein